jgi:hypothetical protein
VFGVVPSVEATDRSTKSAGAAVRENIKPRPQGDGLNNCKTKQDKKRFGKEPSVTGNPFAVLQKQKTCRRKKSLPRLFPLPRRLLAWKAVLTEYGGARA